MNSLNPTSGQNAERWMPNGTASEPQHVPMKIYRTPERLAVAAPMAGLEPGDITVQVTLEGRLLVQGAVRGVLKGDKEIVADEWNPGPYEREVQLPVAVDAQLANVTYGNGVLVVVLPVINGGTRPVRLTLETTGPAHGERAGNAGHPVQSFTAEEHHVVKNSTSSWRAMLAMSGD